LNIEKDDMAQYYVTEKGYHKLKEEIKRIDKLVKNDIAKEIAAAAAHGDLKENAEYHAAKERQAHYAQKLSALQERFTGANVVRREELLPEDAVTFGKTVKIKDVNSGAERVCTILGEGETDREKGIIAYTSPLAKALIGNKQGEVVDVQLPVGVKTFEILEVEFFEDFRD
jgi:transcription elongation factor GreA